MNFQNQHHTFVQLAKETRGFVLCSTKVQSTNLPEAMTLMYFLPSHKYNREATELNFHCGGQKFEYFSVGWKFQIASIP